MRVLVHFGFPKSASSNLQFALWKPLDESGFLNLRTWRKNDEKEVLVDRPSSRLFVRKPILERHLDFERDKLNILSDESFTAPVRLRRNNFGENIETPEAFPSLIYRQIKDKYPEAQIEALIVLRNHVDLLFSQYVEEYNLKKYRDINLIFSRDGKNIDLSGFNIYFFNNYIEILEKTLGQENVNVLFYEQLFHDREGFLSEISRLCQIDLTTVRKAFSEYSFNSKEKNEVGYFTKDKSELIPFLNNEQRSSIQSHFEHDTNKLKERFSERINLENFGY